MKRSIFSLLLFIPFLTAMTASCSEPSFDKPYTGSGVVEPEPEPEQEEGLPKLLINPVEVSMTGSPAIGKLVKDQLPEYYGTDVYHMVYMPKNYKSGTKYPVIVEITGNYYPASGSTGRVEDAHLGYTTSLGEDFIWIVAPCVSANGKSNEVTWWGDEAKTVDYLKKLVPFAQKEYRADIDRVLLCGFSRGGVGVGYLGLHDAEVAKLWSAFYSHEHFDGERSWGTTWAPDIATYRAAAAERLKRVDGREWYISSNDGGYNYQGAIEAMGVGSYAKYIYDIFVMKNYFRWPNKSFVGGHNDYWAAFDFEHSQKLRTWLYKVMSVEKQK